MLSRYHNKDLLSYKEEAEVERMIQQMEEIPQLWSE
jgi:hypothetical protein